jgi:hypothetical protein
MVQRMHRYVHYQACPAALRAIHPCLAPHLHPRPALGHQVLLLPLLTAARLPLGGAQVAELVAAAARDVVAAMVQGHNEPAKQSNMNVYLSDMSELTSLA